VKLVHAVAACVLVISFPCAGDIFKGPVINPANGHNYYVVSGYPGSVGTWSQGRAEAMSLGGDLVEIDDADENAFVLNLINSVTTPALKLGGGSIGLRRQPPGPFAWTNGDPLTYANWAPGAPSDQLANADYAFMYANRLDPTLSGQWGNEPDNASFRGAAVVEVVPEPVGLGGAVWVIVAARRPVARRRRECDGGLR
jgi:hypothetical protein